MEGNQQRSFIGELSREVLIALIVVLLGAAATAVLALGAIGVLLVLIFALVIAASLRLRLPERYLDWRDRRIAEKAAPPIVLELMSYMTHLRDVTKAFWRVRSDRPEEVSRRVRDEILEPIRGLLTTPPGCEVKVVWFRPDDDRKDLVMYEQVGHTEEGEQALRLRVGGSAAGKAFVDEEIFYSGDCENDPAFQRVDKGKASGTLACIPILRGTEVTGVLSVLANWTDAFWLSDIAYFEALASAIGALEPLEKAGDSADEPK